MEPGARIGKYVIESLLGEGGNGAVYAARDGVLGRPVAVKLLHPHLVYDATVAARFRQEAQAMAQLNHPNVVIVYDFVASETKEGQPHWAIVMELVEGGQTLAAILRREGALAPERAARLVANVAAALGYGHARGIVHRDVKPANVMVVSTPGSGEVAKLTDFGIARVMHGERRTQAALTLGTIWYLAPEQAQSSSVDARADVYSLGVTLFEALTGRVPFPYDNVARALAAHVSEAPPPPSSVVPGIPASLDAIVLRCLAKSPSMRPANGDELRVLLEDALRSLEPSAGSMRPPAYGTPTPSPYAASTPGAAPHSPSARPVASTQAMSMVGPGVAPVGASTPAPGVASPPAAATSTGGLSTSEKRIGLYIGIGALVLVVGVCLLGDLLCVIAYNVR